jgi:cytochrome c-type biogenesis protein CcmH
MRRLEWVLMAFVLVVALVVGGRGDGSPRTPEERVNAIAREVRCPTCQGLSAAESDAKAAQAVRDEIRRRVSQGQDDGAIRAYLVSRYGRDILLKPEASGVASLVWTIPVVAGIAAVAGLVAAFLRWRRRTEAEVTDEDRALVEEALRR